VKVTRTCVVSGIQSPLRISGYQSTFRGRKRKIREVQTVMRKNGRKSLISKHMLPADAIGADVNNSLMGLEDLPGQRGDRYGPNSSYISFCNESVLC